MFKKQILVIIFILAIVMVVSGCSKDPVVVEPETNKTTKPEFEEKKLSDNPFVVEPMDKSNWQTYRNDYFGFEMKYPDNWTIKEDVQNKDSEEELISRRVSEFWSITFNSHILIDGSPHLVYLFFEKRNKKSFEDYPDYYNDDIKLYAGEKYPTYLREWHVQKNDTVLKIEKTVEIGEGLGIKPVITREENTFVFSIFDNMIQTIKFSNPSK